MKTLTINDLQVLCQTARNHFEHGRVIIAGGAPRDILHGRPVKDIDIFVQVGEHDLDDAAFVNAYVLDFEDCKVLSGSSKFMRACESLAAALGGKAVFRESPEAYGGLADLCDIEIPGGTPVQIIALFNDPVDDVHDYDFGLSQVFVTARGVFMTPAYRIDDSCKSITYLHEPAQRTPDQFERSRKRLGRLREKYTDWDFQCTASLDLAHAPDNTLEEIL